MKLSDMLKPEQPKGEVKRMWNYTILDVSGSMNDRDTKMVNGKWEYGPTKHASAIQGINADIASMKEDGSGVKFVVGIVEFSGDSRYAPYLHYKVKDVDISEVNYVPGRVGGGTPLVATLGEVINDLCIHKPQGEPCLITVFTDGDDNTSQSSKWSHPGELRKLIEVAEKNHNISVKFIGTETDVDKMVSYYGIARHNTLKYDGTSAGLERGFAAKNEGRIAYTKSFASGASADELTRSANFFTEPKDPTNKESKSKKDETKK